MLGHAMLLLTFSLGMLGAATPTQGTGIKWMTNYEEALNLAKSESKPMILFFTGSDWCGWCNKLEQEVFDQPEFISLAGDKYIFVRLDFPLYAALPAQLSTQNKQLQKKYEIKSFPTLVLIDSADQKQIGVTGYREGGGKSYAIHLQKLIGNYNLYKNKMQNLPRQKLSGIELKKLYEKSKELDLDNDTTYIMRIGMNSDAHIFFRTERYRFLAEEGQIHQQEAIALKKELLALDPHNKELVHYNIAVIEFEALSEENHRSGKETNWEESITPLLTYIDDFGSTDQENLWKLEMIVSQVYLDKNQLPQALNHAQASYKSAPPSVQNEIASAIRSIESQTH